MPRLKFGTARLSVLRSRYSPPERSERDRRASRPRERFSRIASRPPAAHPPPRKLRAVPPSPHDQWNLGRCHFGDGADGSASTIHPVSRHVRPRRRITGTLEGKSAGAATRAARPENVSRAQFYHEFPGMTLPGDPASGHAHTCRKPSEIKVKPPMMLSALPTPYELPLCGLSTFRSVAPLLAHPIRPAAAHTTPVMRPCDPSSSATQHTLTAVISCFNSMYFAPRPCARCPPREH